MNAQRWSGLKRRIRRLSMQGITPGVRHPTCLFHPTIRGRRLRIRLTSGSCPTCAHASRRRFPVACLEDPTMALVWDVESAPKTLRTLDAIARDVGYLGHSTSLVRCRFLSGDSTVPTRPPSSAQRRVYPGRLAELERAHHANPTRPMILPGAGVPPSYGQESSPPDPGWLVLEVVDGIVPDIRAAALVTRVLRHTLMSGYRAIGMAEGIPEIVSGHTADRKPTRSPHVAIVPMAFVGFPHSDGRVFGFALIPPAQTELQDISGFRAAFEKVAPFDPGDERRVLGAEWCATSETVATRAGGDGGQAVTRSQSVSAAGTDLGHRDAPRARPASQASR